MVVAFYFRLHLAYFPRPVVAIFARPEQRLFTTRYKSPLLGSKEPQGIGQTPILCGLILCEAYSID